MVWYLLMNKILSFYLALFCSPLVASAAGNADTLYQDHNHCLYQIRVVENISGKKATIGSAFCVNTKGLLATNYHVVSQAFRYPDRYRLECTSSDGELLALQIKDIDVIHDLAVVQSDRTLPQSLRLNPSDLQKGTTIYALGNPMDLGMTIVDGTYNGLLEKSFYEKILFSGSLNSGMSGGPAINFNGHVIGVNVSTRGKQISFLVPVKYLQQMLDRIDGTKEEAPDLQKRAEQQLIENQNQYMSRLLTANWVNDPLGNSNVPRIDDDAIASWGNTPIDEEALYNYTYISSRSKDWIYLAHDLSTGRISYTCRWYETEELNTFRFYTMLEKEFGKSLQANNAGEIDVTNFESTSRFVQLDRKSWRVVFSCRNYKKFPELYDVVVKMISVSEPQAALLVDLELLGVTQDMGLKFTQKVMEAIQWEN